MKFSPNQPSTHRSTGLSRKKTTADPGSPPACARPPPAPAAPAHVATPASSPSSETPRAAAGLLFCCVGVGRIVSTYHVFATTGDEPAHIACGLQYVAQHVYHYETQHPPLTRAMIALLPYLNGTRPRGQADLPNRRLGSRSPTSIIRSRP